MQKRCKKRLTELGFVVQRVYFYIVLGSKQLFNNQKIKIMTQREHNQNQVINIIVNFAKENERLGKDACISKVQGFILENGLSTKKNSLELAAYCYNQSQI